MEAVKGESLQYLKVTVVKEESEVDSELQYSASKTKGEPSMYH